MSVPDKSIDPRILDSAKREFLEKGFEAASLKSICDGANITTGALYKRYKGKEELFCAVVADTLADIEVFIQQKIELNPADLTDRQLIDCWDMNSEEMERGFRFMFDHRDGMYLLLACSQGTRYADFEHEWVMRIEEKNRDYVTEAQRRSLMEPITNEELHILLSAYWKATFEPIIHKFTWEQIESHCKRVCAFFDWHRALGFIDRNS